MNCSSISRTERWWLGERKWRRFAEARMSEAGTLARSALSRHNRGSACACAQGLGEIGIFARALLSSREETNKKLERVRDIEKRFGIGKRIAA
jgi:hypothetical protein